MTADKIIKMLNLTRHPEGGWYARTFEDAEHFDSTKLSDSTKRSHSTAIYYLLKRDEVSHWHRVDAVEIWHFYAGSPLEIRLSTDGVQAQHHILGSDLENNQRPQIIVEKDLWQSAKSLGDWTLVGCTVAPGFEFAGFEMASPDFDPKL